MSNIYVLVKLVPLCRKFDVYGCSFRDFIRRSLNVHYPSIFCLNFILYLEFYTLTTRLIDFKGFLKTMFLKSTSINTPYSNLQCINNGTVVKYQFWRVCIDIKLFYIHNIIFIIVFNNFKLCVFIARFYFTIYMFICIFVSIVFRLSSICIRWL